MLSPSTLQPMMGPVCQVIATTASGDPRVKEKDGYAPRGTASKVLIARSGHPKSQQHSSLLGHLSCVATIHTPSVQGYVRCNNKAPALAGARISPSTPLQGNGEGAFPARRRVTLKDTRRLHHNWLWAHLSLHGRRNARQNFARAFLGSHLELQTYFAGGTRTNGQISALTGGLFHLDCRIVPRIRPHPLSELSVMPPAVET